MGPERSRSEVYYRWIDAEGRLHVVSSVDDVPSAARAKAERLELNPETSRQMHSAGYPKAPAPPAFELDFASFGVGFAAALCLALLFRLLPQSMRWMSRVVIVVCLGGLLVGAYLGLVRRQSGLGQDAFASPSAIVEDAKSAVEKMNLRQKRQDEELRRIMNDAK
jgi:hypothetical protein